MNGLATYMYDTCMISVHFMIPFAATRGGCACMFSRLHFIIHVAGKIQSGIYYKDLEQPFFKRTNGTNDAKRHDCSYRMLHARVHIVYLEQTVSHSRRQSFAKMFLLVSKDSDRNKLYS